MLHHVLPILMIERNPMLKATQKLTWTLAALCLSSAPLVLAKATLTTDVQKVSYAIGRQVGTRIESQGISIDTDVLKEAIKDVLEKKPSQMTDAEMNAAMEKERGKMQERLAVQAKKNAEEETAFLEKNKKQAGIVTTASGLQYKIVTAGKGEMPKDASKVKVHYSGTLLDGKVFDSSYTRGEPVTFPVNGVIPGWTEALKLMQAGAKWELTIPSKLAYGAAGAPGIPPNSVLKFTVELLEVLKDEPAPAATATPAAKTTHGSSAKKTEPVAVKEKDAK